LAPGVAAIVLSPSPHVSLIDDTVEPELPRHFRLP
jgi:hypothetical protein